MTDAEYGYICDLLEGIKQRLVRTESKLSALINQLNLSQNEGAIDPTYSGYRPNTRSGAAGTGSSGPNQRPRPT